MVVIWIQNRRERELHRQLESITSDYSITALMACVVTPLKVLCVLASLQTNSSLRDKEMDCLNSCDKYKIAQRMKLF